MKFFGRALWQGSRTAWPGSAFQHKNIISISMLSVWQYEHEEMCSPKVQCSIGNDSFYGIANGLDDRLLSYSFPGDKQPHRWPRILKVSRHMEFITSVAFHHVLLLM